MTLTLRQIQRLLHVEPDGDFGAKSRTALSAFQSTHGLKVDGVPGPRSAAALLLAEAGTQIASLPAGPRRRALEAALRDVGRRESTPNAGPEIAHLDPRGVPWCASAVCAWAGVPRIAKVLHDPAHPEWPSLESRYRSVLSEVPEPGSFLLMGRGGSGSDAGGSTAGHTGIVVGRVGPDVLSIDGNVGDAVAVMLRPTHAIRWFCEWWRLE